MPVEAVANRRRVFFALWPDAITAERLDRLGQHVHGLCGGRRMQRDSLHMTLFFIGDAPVERVEALCLAASQVMAPSFSLCLDQIAHWRHNHIVWAGCGQSSLPLLSLVSQLAERLQEAGLSPDVHDFVAHVTLLRNVFNVHDVTLPECIPLAWSVNEFVLAESCLTSDGNHYRIIDHWPLLQGEE